MSKPKCYKSSYAEKLKDPRWQRKRLEILNRDEFKCVNCGTTEKSLQVHHHHYTKGDPWETPSAMLSTLCDDCHSERHPLEKQAKEIFAEIISCIETQKHYWEESSKFQRFLTSLSNVLVEVRNGECEVYSHNDICKAFDEGCRIKEGENK